MPHLPELVAGDCVGAMQAMVLMGELFDAIVTDPPYDLVSVVKRFGGKNAAPARPGTDGAFVRQSKGFMGKQWDGTGIAFKPETWQAAFDVMKPGAHLVAFGGSRTFHRMAVAIEDAGFEIRDTLMWIYGTGFPKSHDVSKGIDATLTRGSARTEDMRRMAMGDDYEVSGRGRANYDHGGGSVMNGSTAWAPDTFEAACWSGFGTALKPAFEPIILARKPLDGTVAGNTLKHGVGGINIDGCRPGTRHPANILHDGSDEVVSMFPDSAGQLGRARSDGSPQGNKIYGALTHNTRNPEPRGDSGSAARFFFNTGDQAWHAQNHPKEFAKDAARSFLLDGPVVVSALSHAVDQSTGRSTLINTAYQAQSMSVTENELNEICRLVTSTIQSFAERCSSEQPPERHIQSSNLALCVAAPKQTGIITITISLWKSSGFVEVVTFEITSPNMAPGEKDSVAGSRLHYSAKASKADRAGSDHPTIKPLALMRWLCRLVTPPGGRILDPFAGSGTTLQAAYEEGFDAVGCEQDPDYCVDIMQRLAAL